MLSRAQLVLALKLVKWNIILSGLWISKASGDYLMPIVGSYVRIPLRQST
jgi:hypothetical protein